MELDLEMLHRFEEELIPHDLSRSNIPAEILGYGEISSIFRIDNRDDVVYKRMPIFRTAEQADTYRENYLTYCDLLRKAGILIPEDDVAIVRVPGRPVVAYFAQFRFPDQLICHRLINTLDEPGIRQMLADILDALRRVQQFNEQHLPETEIAVDAQLSNWVWQEENGSRKLYLLDTTTPMFRIQRIEQLDLELFLESIPPFIRWLVRRLGLEEVIDRYYDLNANLTDLVANLYKEQRPDLIPLFVEVINGNLPRGVNKLERKAIDDYYREDKMIWAALSLLRRTDRFITTRILRRRYEFILPGRVKR